MKVDLAQHRHRKEKVEQVKALMDQLIDHTNAMGMDEQVAQGMLEALVSNHPTLVQGFMRAFKTTCDKASQHPRFINADLRSQATAKFIKEIAEKDVHFPFI